MDNAQRQGGEGPAVRRCLVVAPKTLLSTVWQTELR